MRQETEVSADLGRREALFDRLSQNVSRHFRAQRSQHWRGFVVVGAMVLSACAVSPTGRRQLTVFPEEQMTALGTQSFESLKNERPVSGDLPSQRLIECIVEALTRELPSNWQTGWEVVVFEDPSANAFALPGRKIGVHTGLLEVAETPDQLAAVLGHEVAHVMARHGNERLSQQQMARLGLFTATLITDPNTAKGQRTLAALGMGAEYGVLLPFSRAHEREADELGLVYMARAGFDPAQSVTLWENMATQSTGHRPPEWMSTHPSTERRIVDLKAQLPEVLPLYHKAAEPGGKLICQYPGERSSRTH